MAEKNLDLAARLRPALAGFEPYDPARGPVATRRPSSGSLTRDSPCA